MPEYNLGFSKKLAETASLVAHDDVDSFDAIQTVVYLSLLACEIALKALLEKSGMHETQIRKFRHNLEALLCQVSRCEVAENILGHLTWVPAVRIRGIPIKFEDAESTVGELLTGEKKGALGHASEANTNIRTHRLFKRWSSYTALDPAV